MNREDIIRMALEAGLVKPSHPFNPWGASQEALERFAVLVAAAEREAIKWNSIHSCHADCQNPACVIVREAVAAEREACAKVCEDIDKEYDGEDVLATWCAAAIRARAQG
jgi:hypothetical protein